jgi:hypothetical protein
MNKKVPTAFSRADERFEVRTTFFPYDGKLFLKAVEPQVGQWHKDVESKQEFYHIIIFPERTWNITSRKKRSSEHHSDGTLEQHFLPYVQTF